MSDDRERMERLAQTIVDWHNRHPLARRIRVRDVHTVGVVALPFMRSTPAPAHHSAKEPVLTDVVEPTPPAAGTGLDAVLAASLSKAPQPGSTLKGLDGLSRLIALVPGRAPPPAWAAFDEAFLPGVKTRAIEKFVLGHGFPEPPASRDAMPWRVVAVKGEPGEGWPFELYTLSAGIDAGPARTRVLAGRGNPAQILGRRALEPWRVALAGLALAALLGGAAAAARWFTRATTEVALTPAGAASAASASSAASSPDAPSKGTSSPAAVASTPASAASAAEADTAASAASEPAASAAAASDQPPDIRPRFVPPIPTRDGRPRPPILKSAAASDATPGEAARGTSPEPSPAAGDKNTRANPATTGDAAPPAPTAKAPADPRLARLTQRPSSTVVALVGPPGSQAEAQAQLQKMQAGLAGMVGDPSALQAQVLETPDGWRATIWPFTSREQAQLINAVLVARGLKTKAIDF